MAGEGRRRVALVREHLGDGRQPQSETAQQQHPLQADERLLVVVAVAVAAHPARRHEPHLVVVTEGAAGGADEPSDLLYRPFHGSDVRG